jgi:hypothetical protein
MPEPDSTRDRREHPRFDGEMVDVKFRRLNALPSGELDVFHDAQLLNISLNGMLLATNHSINKGEKVEYYVNPKSGKDNREGTGRVTRTDHDSVRFLIAVQFI